MKSSNDASEALAYDAFRDAAEKATLHLIHLYVEGLHLKDDPIERGSVALKINHVMDNMPTQLKDAVIIELMSSLTKAVQMLRKAGVDCG